MSEIQNELFNAVKQNNLKKVKELLDNPTFRSKINLEQKDEYHYSALLSAVTEGHLEIVKHLIEKGASVNTKNRFDETPLMMATKKNHLDCMQYLIDIGCSVDDKNIKKQTALHLAVRYTHEKAIKLLLQNNANPHTKDQTGESILLTAIQSYAKDNILQLLIEEKQVDVNAKNRFGYTPIYWAAKYTDIHSMKYLLEHGADINIKDNEGITPLINAVILKKTKSIEFLIEHGADINATDNNGNTALIHSLNNPKITQFLINNGADITIKNKEAQSPLTWAMSHSDTQNGQYILTEWLKNSENITPKKLRDLKQINPKDLQKLLITGELLTVLKQQAYEQQVESYITIRDILLPEQKKEFEKHIRSKRKEKGKE